MLVFGFASYIVQGREGGEKWERESLLSPIPPLLLPAYVYCV